jgi:ribose transport system permease protein
MPVVVLITLVLAVSATSPSFLSVYSLRVLAAESSVILLLATGQTLVVIMGGIDLSVAALASLTSVIVALALPGFGVAAVPGALIVAAALGALQGFVHARAQLPSFIVTLAGLGLWSGIALAIAETTVPVAGHYEAIGWLDARTGGLPHGFVFGLVVLGLFQLALARLRFGRCLYAIGMAERVALVSGIRVSRVKTLAFSASGLCAGLAGVVLVARTGSGNPTIADSLLLPGIAAVLIGGTAITGGHGTLARTLLGVCIVTVLRVGVTLAGVAPAYEPMAYGALVIVAVALTVDRRSIGIVR